MRYLIKFRKTDNMIYISHLDLQRLFHRALRSADFDLKYSKGFNPHPKIIFAQPLSLGFFSESEFVEFESNTHQEGIDDKLKKLKSWMPDGIEVISLKKLELPSKKSLASLVDMSKYKLLIRSDNEQGLKIIHDGIKIFMEEEEILTEKISKKKIRQVVNIRPLIIEAEGIMLNDNELLLTTILKSANNLNLNPLLFLNSLFSYFRLEENDFFNAITRVGMYKEDGNPIEA